MRYFLAQIDSHQIVITPLVHPHFLTHEIDARGGALVDGFTGQEQVDRYCGLMPMSDRSNNILWTKSGISTEEHFRVCRLEGAFVNSGHVPFTKLDTQVALNPWERIVLAYRNQDFIGLEKDFVAGGH